MTGDIPHIDPDKWRPSPWRDVKFAPKDWSTVLLFVPELASDWRKVCEGYFDVDNGIWMTPAFGCVEPTHYMPLPEPPKG